MTAAERALQRLDDAVALVRDARAVPVSASVVVSRPDLLALLEDVREAVLAATAAERDAAAVVAAAHEEAARVRRRAEEERRALVDGTDLVAEARARADAVLAEAEQAAERLRREADDWVDGRLAALEVVLGRTAAAVQKGRERLRPGAPDAG